MSMTFSAAKIVPAIFNGEECKFVESVFMAEEVMEYLDHEDGEDPKCNPAYRPELDINLANGNAYGILDLLDYRNEAPFCAPIDEVIERVGICLSGPARSNEYAARKLAAIGSMLREGKQRGATHMSCG